MPTPPPNNPGSCEFRHWTVFAPGYWKGNLYSRADVARMAQNYARLKPHLTPVAKLGHDVDQVLTERLKQSIGFINLGQVTQAGLNSDGSFWLTIAGVPVEVGAQANAGRINTGSIDIEPKAPDPDDPSRTIVGPVLTAISLLGEEQPALKDARLKMPVAVFADGRPVPPAASAAKWLDAMADVSATFSALSGNRRRNDAPVTTRRTLCFSEFSETPPVDPQALIAAFQSLPPDQQQQVMQALAQAGQGGGQQPDPNVGQQPDPNAPPPDKFAAFNDDPDVPDWGKAMMSAFSTGMSSCTQRMGAMEQAISGIKPAAEQAAAFSAEYRASIAKQHKQSVTRDVEQAISEGRLEFRDKQTFIDAGLAKSTALVFADGANSGKSHYEAWRDELLSRKPSAMFSDAVDDSAAGSPDSDSFLKNASKHLPGLREPAYVPASMAQKK